MSLRLRAIDWLLVSLGVVAGLGMTWASYRLLIVAMGR